VSKKQNMRILGGRGAIRGSYGASVDLLELDSSVGPVENGKVSTEGGGG